MAFTSRASRFKNGIGGPSTTSTKVGPGSYNTGKRQQQNKKFIKHHDPSIFSETQPRGLLYYVVDEYAPCPGQYFHIENTTLEGCSLSSFKSGTKRFAPVCKLKEQIPGPGSYNIDKDGIGDIIKADGGNMRRIDYRQMIRPSSSRSFRYRRMDDEYGGGGGAEYSNVEQRGHILMKNPPSIPYGENAHGYETTIDGKLVPRTPPTPNLVQYSAASSIPNNQRKYNRNHKRHSYYTNNMTPSYYTDKSNRNYMGYYTQIKHNNTNGNEGVGWSKSKTIRFHFQDYEGDGGGDRDKATQFQRRYPLLNDVIQQKIKKGKHRNNILNDSKLMAQSTLKEMRRYCEETVAVAASDKKNNPMIDEKSSNTKLMNGKFITISPSTAPFKSKTKRFDPKNGFFGDVDIPGPGAYDLCNDTKTQRIEQHYGMLNNARQAMPGSNIGQGQQPTALPPPPPPPPPRFNENKEKQFIPGPGSYDIRSTFKSLEDLKARNIQLGQPPKAPFSSTIARFTDAGTAVAQKQQMPGPAHYNKEKIGGVGSRPSGIKIKYHKAPFGQHGPRQSCLTDKVRAAIPGPGEYDVGLAAEILANKKAKAVSAFKSGSKRIDDRQQRQKQALPGPGTYNLAKNGIGNATAQQCDTETPTVHSLYRYVHPNVGKKQETFISSEARFRNPRETGSATIPGPGTYNLKREISDAYEPQSMLQSDAPFGYNEPRMFSSLRSMESAKKMPGPSDYVVIKKDSLVKKSYNCTFG